MCTVYKTSSSHQYTLEIHVHVCEVHNSETFWSQLFAITMLHKTNSEVKQFRALLIMFTVCCGGSFYYTCIHVHVHVVVCTCSCYMYCITPLMYFRVCSSWLLWVLLVEEGNRFLVDFKVGSISST